MGETLDGNVGHGSLSTVRKLKQLREALHVLDVNEKEGTVTAYGERFMFIPVKLIHSIEDRLTQSFGPVTATSFQYEIGRDGGAHYMRIAEKAGFNIRNFQELQKVARRLGTLGGWGRLQVTQVDFDKKVLRVRWTNGVSVRNKKGKTSVCHFGRGILTGATEVIFKTGCESLETSCEGKGDNFCEAVIAEPDEIARLADTRNR